VHSSVDVKQALEDKSAVDIENDHTSSAHLDLFGRDLGERAIREMWNRRMELEILEPIANAFRHRVSLFANRLDTSMRKRRVPWPRTILGGSITFWRTAHS
jgi:hypothetical protein